MSGFVLTGEMLAQHRGCVPDNDCYPECADAGRAAIDDPEPDPGRRAEIAQATGWARRQHWAGTPGPDAPERDRHVTDAHSRRGWPGTAAAGG